MLHEVLEQLDEVRLVGVVEAERRADERKEMDAPLGARLTELEAMAPGPALATALLEVMDKAVTTMGQIRIAALWTRMESWTQAQSMRAWADPLSPAGSIGEFEQLVCTDLALSTHISEGSALRQADLVQRIRVQMAAAWEALNAGAITKAHLLALDEATRSCPRYVAVRVDELLIPRCVELGWTPWELKRAAQEAVIQTDPTGAAERAKTAKKYCSDVTFRPGEDEMACVDAYGDAATMRQVMDAIDARADGLERKRDGETVSLGERRIAALADLVLGELARTPKVEVVVTMDLPTYLGLNDQPGELSGYGPVTAETARDMARDAELRRLITDPLTGRALDLSRDTYRPSRQLARFIEIRDRTCRFPGCIRRATHCDIDHICADSEGGLTECANLHTLCRKHHEYKTKRRWRVDVHPDGSETWISPFGFKRHKAPPRYQREALEPVEKPDDDDGSHVPIGFYQSIVRLNPATADSIHADTAWWTVDPPRWIDDDPDTDNINTDALDAYFTSYYGSGRFDPVSDLTPAPA